MHMCTWLKAVVSCVTWVLGAEVRKPVRAATITESSMQPLAELLTKCALKTPLSLKVIQFFNPLPSMQYAFLNICFSTKHALLAGEIIVPTKQSRIAVWKDSQLNQN